MTDHSTSRPYGPRIGDAFGETVLAHHAGLPTFAVMERDDGLVTPHDPAMYFTGPEDWNAAELDVCERVTGTVLDLGCGAGRHALFLQEKGFDVVGVDPSAGACEVSTARGVRQVRQLGLEDLANPDTLDGQKFDTIVMLGANLGLLGSIELAPDRLAALAAVAAPGARIIGTGGFGSGTDPLHHAYHERNRAAGRLPGTLRIRTRFRDLADPWVDLLFCTSDELADLVDGSAWHIERIDSDGDGFLTELRYVG